MFDEQRVNTAGNCQRIRGYCLHSSGRPRIQEESKEEGEREKEVVQRALEGVRKCMEQEVAGGDIQIDLTSYVAHFESNSNYGVPATKMRFCPRLRNMRLSDDEFPVFVHGAFSMGRFSSRFTSATS